MWGRVSALDELLECTSFSAWGIAFIRWWNMSPCPLFHPHQMCSFVMLLGLPHPLTAAASVGSYHLMSEIQQQSSCWSLCLNFPISSASFRCTKGCQLYYFLGRLEGLCKSCPNSWCVVLLTAFLSPHRGIALCAGRACAFVWLSQLTHKYPKIPLFQKAIKLLHKCHIQLSHGNLSRIIGVPKVNVKIQVGLHGFYTDILWLWG